MILIPYIRISEIKISGDPLGPYKPLKFVFKYLSVKLENPMLTPVSKISGLIKTMSAVAPSQRKELR